MSSGLLRLGAQEAGIQLGWTVADGGNAMLLVLTLTNWRATEAPEKLSTARHSASLCLAPFKLASLASEGVNHYAKERAEATPLRVTWHNVHSFCTLSCVQLFPHVCVLFLG